MRQDTNVFRGIRKAALAIAYDNGMINRDNSEEQFLDRVDEIIGADGVDSMDIKTIDTFLLTLDDEQMNYLCAGGDEEPEKSAVLVLWAEFSLDDTEKLDGLLNDIFEA